MEMENFYGVTLDDKKPLDEFDFCAQDKLLGDQKLIIKQIILGPDAIQGEFNVVQVETQTPEKETIKIPIAVLKSDETRILKPNIEFTSVAVKFSLIQGAGPVHIHGQHIFIDKEEDYEDIYYEVEEMEEEAAHRIQNTNGKKAHKKKQ